MCFLFVNYTYSADQDMIDVYKPEIEGSIYDFISGDFNGDKLKDLAIIYSSVSDSDSGHAAIFIQSGESGFSRRADLIFDLPPSAAQIDAGDINGDGSDEIVIVDSRGILAYHYGKVAEQRALARIIEENTIYSTPIFRGIVVSPILAKLSNAQLPDIICPNHQGYSIWRIGSDRNFHLLSNLAAPLISRSSGKGLRDLTGSKLTEFSFSSGTFYPMDGNHDGRTDLYFIIDNDFCCYYQNGNGGFSSAPDFRFDFCAEQPDVFVQSRLLDLNNDGSPDLIASCTSGGITRAESRVRFYLSGSDGRVSAIPQKEIKLSDSYCGLLINDYNSDGQLEMIVPAVELGAIAATKMLLMKKADLHLLVYPISNGFPENEPFIRPSFEFQFNFDNPDPTREVYVDWSADFNGDKLIDMVMCDGSGYLQFFMGRSKDFLPRKPDLKIALDHPLAIRPLNLKGSSKSDLVIEHVNNGGLNHLTVLRNKSN